MDRMTAGQMLGRVDALLPNQYGREEKMQWLAQAEGFVLREAEQATGALPQVTEEYALTGRRGHRPLRNAGGRRGEVLHGERRRAR